jgi:hypothetical protein
MALTLRLLLPGMSPGAFKSTDNNSWTYSKYLKDTALQEVF